VETLLPVDNVSTGLSESKVYRGACLNHSCAKDASGNVLVTVSTGAEMLRLDGDHEDELVPGMKRIDDVDGDCAKVEASRDKSDKAGVGIPESKVYRGVCLNHSCDMYDSDGVSEDELASKCKGKKGKAARGNNSDEQYGTALEMYEYDYEDPEEQFWAEFLGGSSLQWPLLTPRDEEAYKYVCCSRAAWRLREVRWRTEPRRDA